MSVARSEFETRASKGERLSTRRRPRPALVPGDRGASSCTYTSTSTPDFVLARAGPIVVGAGFSGHVFKFVPTIGRILADLVEGTARPAERFSSSRA